MASRRLLATILALSVGAAVSGVTMPGGTVIDHFLKRVQELNYPLLQVDEVKRLLPAAEGAQVSTQPGAVYELTWESRDKSCHLSYEHATGGERGLPVGRRALMSCGGLSRAAALELGTRWLQSVGASHRLVQEFNGRTHQVDDRLATLPEVWVEARLVPGHRKWRCVVVLTWGERPVVTG